MPLLQKAIEPRWSPFTEGSRDFHKHPEDWRPYMWV
jgi:hypothetical protein